MMVHLYFEIPRIAKKNEIDLYYNLSILPTEKSKLQKKYVYSMNPLVQRKKIYLYTLVVCVHFLEAHLTTILNTEALIADF